MNNNYLPTVAILGRANVGKSTLFNRLTFDNSESLVSNIAGSTRDKIYGVVNYEDKGFIIIDTGGFEREKDTIKSLTTDKTREAALECDVAILMVDGKVGLVHQDIEIVKFLRENNIQFIIAVNKLDNYDDEIEADFYSIGIKLTNKLSASHNIGISDLLNNLVSILDFGKYSIEQSDEDDNEIDIAIVGRPNVGKSTLINKILGYERSITSNIPGTTTGPVVSKFAHEGRNYRLHDTAGVRRKTKIEIGIEKQSMIQSFQTICMAKVCMLVTSAEEGITDQDLKLLSYILDMGRGCIILINKWDVVQDKKFFEDNLSRKLDVAKFVSYKCISALKNIGLRSIFKEVNKIYRSFVYRCPTAKLNDILAEATSMHPAPKNNGVKPKLRYAHFIGSEPPRIVVHGRNTSFLTKQYIKFINNFIRKQLNIYSVPIKIKYKD